MLGKKTKETPKLNAEVAEKYDFDGSFAVQVISPEYGNKQIDIRTITVKEVDELVAKGYPHFTLKPKKKETETKSK